MPTLFDSILEKWAQLYSVPSLFLVIGMDYVTTYSDYAPTLAFTTFLITAVVLFWLEFLAIPSRKPVGNQMVVERLFAILVAAGMVALPTKFISVIFVSVMGYEKLFGTSKTK